MICYQHLSLSFCDHFQWKCCKGVLFSTAVKDINMAGLAGSRSCLKILNSNADFNQFLATSLDKTVPARKEGEMVKRECSKMVDSDHCPLQTFSLLYGYTCP